MMRISRRHGLIGFFLVLAGRRAVADDAGLGSLFTRPDAARAIGAAYLRAYPQEARVVRSLRIAANGREDVATRVRADFAGGDVVMVEGWMLSRTEARLCALACARL